MRIEEIRKIPLHDKTAEIGVIGTLLVNNEFALRSNFLKHTHFYTIELGHIYKAIMMLMEKGITTFDTFSLLAIIESNKDIKEGIIFAGITDIIEFLEDCKLVARSEYTEFELLTQRIMTLSFKRTVSLKLRSLIDECYSDTNEGLNEFNYKLQNEITNLANNYMFGNDTPLLSDTVRDVWDKIKSQRSLDGTVGIPSTYKSVNSLFTYRKKGLVIIGGRAKSGKSIFVSNEVYHKVRGGAKVAIFDTELSTEDWLPRFLAEITGLTIRQIESGEYTNDEGDKVENALNWIEDGTLIHKYDSEWTMDKIYTRAKQIKLSHGLDFLVYDYIKADDIDLKGVQEHAYLGKLTSFLKNKIAGELDIAVCAPAQMNDNELRLADSRKIQRYASTIFYWMEKDYDRIASDGADEGTHYGYVDFNRHGGKHKSDSKGNPVTYINFVMDGDRATIKMAKNPYHLGRCKTI